MEENNKDLRFFVMDGDKNDLDKHFHEHLPMLFVIKKGMKVKAFQGKMLFDDILGFLRSEIKNLKVSLDEGL